MTIPGASGDAQRLIDRRMALAREWDDLVEQARALPGFEDFLRPPPLRTLQEAAANGPVVVINVSKWRCDALIVTGEGVRSIGLPQLTADEVSARTSTYLRALQATSDVPVAPSLAEVMRLRGESMAALRATLSSTLEWLWDVVAEPVLQALGFDSEPADGRPWPRLWWCPTGLLTLLPIHGAGYHGPEDGRTVLDRVISSYTPTLRVLAESTRIDATVPDPPELLFVGVPNSDNPLALDDEVDRELQLFRGVFPGELTVLDGARATVDAVSEALAAHRWTHISCHGHQDLDDPSAAGFELFDGRLTVTRISAARHHGEFAFLSACNTATGGLRLPDEVITLAAALSYTGYRHVVATLWAVNPSVVADVSKSVYDRLVNNSAFDPGRSAEALHNAVRTLRAAGRPLDNWLPFVHNGP